MKRIGVSLLGALYLSILASPVPAPAQSSSTTRVTFAGTTKVTGGTAARLPSGRLFVKSGPEVDVSFEVPGVNGNNSPARLPASAVPKPAGNSVVSGDFLGFGALTQFDQAIAPTGNPDGFNFQVEPPDQGLTVGNGFVVETVNNAILILNLGGGVPVFESMNLFFNLAPEATVTAGGLVFGPDLSDPRAYFDAATGRFFVTETEIDTDPTTGADIGPAHVYIAVSQTGDPTGLWNIFTLDVTSDHDSRFGTCPCFADNPLIGPDQNGFYISPNAFNIASRTFRGEQLYAISKTLLETTAGGSVAAVRFHDLNEAEGPARSLAPATVPPGGSFETAANGTEYFVSSLDFTHTLDNRLAVWALTNTASLNSTPALALTSVIINTEVYGQPPTTDQQPGPLPLLDYLASPQSVFGTFKNHEELVTANDDRMQQVVFAQGMLWTALNTVVKPQGPVRVGVAWFIISPTVSGDVTLSASVANQGYVSIASAQQNSVMFPSVGVNAAGGAVIAFSVIGENFYPSAAYALLDPVLGAGSIVISGPGVAPDDGFSGYAPFSTRVARWGDYSAAVSDEFGNIWMGNEMIPPSPPLPPGALAANWGTFITVVTP